MGFVIYGNGSSMNHGCEAIVRGTVALLGKKNDYFLQCQNPAEDAKYGLDQLAELWQARSGTKKSLRFILAYLRMKLLKDYAAMDGMGYIAGIGRAAQNAKIAISVGGDNYCYPGTEIYGWLNKEYKKNGMKTVLWGCSVEPEIVARPKVSKDLARYDMIVSRESLTYNAVKKVHKNTFLAPDPAFFMEPQTYALEKNLNSENLIGINASPHILKCETVPGAAYENYKNLIAYILDHTDSYIALIPHVVWDTNDDRKVLRQLYDDFAQNERLILVDDHSAPELKYIISKCRMFIGARTHATIAAYSTCVPTLVVGYSVKARGIARDLFGTEENYVLPVQALSEPNQLTAAFNWLQENEQRIKTHLERFLPDYLASAEKVIEAIKRME